MTTRLALVAAFSLALAVPAAAAETAVPAFGSVWVGLVEQSDGDRATVRLERCLALWEGEELVGCGVAEGGPAAASFLYAHQPVVTYARPLDAVEATGAAGFSRGERVVVWEAFTRTCGDNRPDCGGKPALPTYAVRGPMAAGERNLSLYALAGVLAAATGAFAYAASTRIRHAVRHLPYDGAEARARAKTGAIADV